MSATYPLTHGTCCLRPSISCFTQLNTARYTSSSDGTFRLSLEIRSRTWVGWGKKSIQISSNFYIKLNLICLYGCSYQRGRESVLTRKCTHRKDYVTTDRMLALYLLFTSLHSWVSSLPSSSLACAFICSTLTVKNIVSFDNKIKSTNLMQSKENHFRDKSHFATPLFVWCI